MKKLFIKNKKMVWMVVALCVLGGVGYTLSLDKPVVEVDLSPVEMGSIQQTVEETAEIKLDHETQLVAAVSGAVIDVKAQVGQSVKNGDVLVVIDNQGIQGEIASLKSQIKVTTAQYNEAKSPVKSSESAKWEASVAAAEAAYEAAKQTVDKNKALFEAGALSQDAYESSQVDLTAKASALATAKSGQALAKTGVSKNVKAQYEALLADLNAKLSRLEKQQQKYGITATQDGVILSTTVEKGGYVQPGSPLLVIGDTQSIYASCDLLIEDLSGITVGTVVNLENEDLNITGLTGKISKIYPSAFEKLSELGIRQKRVTVEIQLDSVPTGVRAGYDLKATFVVAQKDDVLLVDAKAIFDYQGKNMVFVSDQGVAKLVEVTTGMEGEKMTQVLKGLEKGDQVILSPDETVQEGSRVE